MMAIKTLPSPAAAVYPFVLIAAGAILEAISQSILKEVV